MRNELDDGKIVIAAGFQGVDDDFNITTLGRGGSDTTATALAAVLQADECEIYTDVEGVFTTDPRMVPEARKIDQHLVRRNARTGQPGRGSHAFPVDRVRQEIPRAVARAAGIFRRRGNADRAASRRKRAGRHRRRDGPRRGPRQPVATCPTGPA